MEIENKNEKITSGAHVSYWTDDEHHVKFKQLDANIETDVVIVGGGIAGVSTAYCLAKSGRKVVLVEDGYIGSGETGRTTAHLVTALDDRYYNLEKIHGEKGAHLVAESHQEAIDFIEKTVKEEKIDCDFERLDGYLFRHETDDPDSLNKEFAAATKAGLQIEKLSQVPGMVGTQSCLRFANQAQFHPLKYLKGLCEGIINFGGEIYVRTHADKINSEGITTSSGFTIKANHVVVATNSPVNNSVIPHLKQYAYRTYVIGFKIKKESVLKALWWDTGDYQANSNIPPYHYVRTTSLDDKYYLLIAGGEDHPTGLAEVEQLPEEERYKLLEIWTRNHFPVEEILYQWSGQVLEPMDSLAFMGRNPMDKKNVYIITGDSGNGMTHCTIGALLITDLINGKVNEYEKLYNPARFKIFKAGKTFFTEVVEGIVNYIKLNPKDLDMTQLLSLKKENGIIVKRENEKIGVYRDAENKAHIVSAVCTHLKCVVKWNNDEKSWDCPCHGSRFTIEGKVINGPANENLNYEMRTDISFPEIS